MTLQFATNFADGHLFDSQNGTVTVIAEGMILTGVMWSGTGFVTAFVWMSQTWDRSNHRMLWVLVIVLDTILAIPSGIVFLSQFGRVD